MERLQELTGVEPWPMLLGLTVMAVLVSAVATWPVCALLLWRYRRSVQSGMRRATATHAPAGQGPTARPTDPPPHIDVVDLRQQAPAALVVRARRAGRRAQAAFGAAGLLFGLASTAAYHQVGSLDWAPVRTLSLVLILGWLVVPTVLSLGTTDRRSRWVLWLAYLGAILVLPVLGGNSPQESLSLLLVVVAFPGLFVLATGVRTLRGAAWFVAPALTVLVMAALTLYPVLLYLVLGVPFDRLAWSLLAAAVAAVVSVVLYGWTVALLYTRKWVSDESLLVLQWWFVLALTQVMLLGTQGGAAALLALAPYAVMVLFLLGVATVRRRPRHAPVRLLLLRTFGARRRSSRLLRDLTVHWRWVGSVELVTGTDLATEVLEPHELIEYLTGRLRRRFVHDGADLERRVRELDLLPDRDRRYRVNDMLCHDDMWRLAVDAMVSSVDAVLLDLRGLTVRNTGVVHELERLVALVPLPRVVGLTDGSTDATVLRRALDRAAALAPASSPSRTDPHPALGVVRLSGRRTDDLAALLDAVAHAASRGPARPDGTPTPAGRRDTAADLPGHPHATSQARDGHGR